MKNSTKKIVGIVCAVVAVVCVIFAAFTLVKRKDSTSASSAASSTPTQSTYGKVEDFDYQNFDYSNGLDANGYWSGITALDYVTLPDNAASVPVSKADITPSDTDIQSQIDSLLSQYATSQAVTDRAAQTGDTVNIDYVGTVDGVAFTGGSATGYSLTLGSGSFIDGFEDQIVGHNIGDTFDVNVTFPDGYRDSTDAEGNTVTLSNKAAVFSVTLNSISASVTPELTDDWVDSSFGTSDDIHTVEQLRTFFSDALYSNNLDDAIMNYLLENSTFKEVPSELTSYYICMFLNHYNQVASAYSLDLNTLAQAYGYDDMDSMLGQSDAWFDHLAKQDLLYQAVAESMGIAPTQEELDDASSTYSSTYGANRSAMIALQLAVIQQLEDGAVVS